MHALLKYPFDFFENGKCSFVLKHFERTVVTFLIKNGPTLKKPQEIDKTNNKIIITPPMNKINIRFKTYLFEKCSREVATSEM